MQITTPGKPTDMIRDAELNHVFDFDDFQMNASAVRFSDGKKHRKDGKFSSGRHLSSGGGQMFGETSPGRAQRIILSSNKEIKAAEGFALRGGGYHS